MWIGRNYIPIEQYEVITDCDIYFGIVFVVILLMVIYKLCKK
jgi:hypothetical protein